MGTTTTSKRRRSVVANKGMISYLKSLNRPVYMDLVRILKRKLNVAIPESIKDLSFYDDLGMVDWEMQLLVLYVENHFGISLSDNDVKGIKNVSQMVTLVSQRLRSAIN